MNSSFSVADELKRDLKWKFRSGHLKKNIWLFSAIQNWAKSINLGHFIYLEKYFCMEHFGLEKPTAADTSHD